MRHVRHILIGLLLAGVSGGCRDAPAHETRTSGVNFWIAGSRVGEERASIVIHGQRVELTTITRVRGALEAALDGELILERGRPVRLRVNGDAPHMLPSIVDVSVTPDRTDVFPIRSPLPIHVVSTLVGRAIVSGRRNFRALPAGTVTVSPCAGAHPLSVDATCHDVAGLPSGTVTIWLDRRQALAAAAIPTSVGLLIATTPERDEARGALAGFGR